MSRWFLRGFGDHDTHLGQLRGDRTVLPLCGVVFTPRKLVGDRLALPGEPPDPAQVCPECSKAKRTQ